MKLFLSSLYICLSVSLNSIPYVFLLSLYKSLLWSYYFFSCYRFLSFSSFKHLASTFSIHILLFCMYFSLDYIFLSFSPSLSERIISLIFSFFIFLSCFPSRISFLIFIFLFFQLSSVSSSLCCSIVGAIPLQISELR